ncbi:MAG: histidine ammonia-lyase [Gemmatimonadetes bacterium]|nr:histidine ammonia-lyase [Gemmatimonadota bacterium]
MSALTGRGLTVERVAEVASGRGRAPALSEEARGRVQRAHDYLRAVVARGDKVYGVTTGFGRLADVVISEEQREDLQRNLVRSHAAGVGTPYDVPAVRAMMLLRANALALGHSGCRPIVIDTVLALLDRGVHPVVPSYGSVGASGDLAPLAHIALALLGEGRVEWDGRTVPSAEALAAVGVAPLVLEAKEGLSLINGTQATTGLGLLALDGALRAVDLADVAGALSLDALRGTPEAFRPELQRVRPHPGQADSAARLFALLEGSEIRESHREGDARVQDAYCLRCMPQVHGAARDALAHARRVLEIEANSATDNPLVFPDEDRILSGGNFHAQVVAQALDFMTIVLADLASISERRVERLLNPDLSELPAFLAVRPGIESGFMIAQVTAADLGAELRVLSHPASVDSVSTSAAREDHVSMGLTAARKARRALELLEYVLAIELLCAGEAIERRRPLRTAPALERVVACMRTEVPALSEDRSFSPDLEAIRSLIRSGRLVEAVGRVPHGGAP